MPDSKRLTVNQELVFSDMRNPDGTANIYVAKMRHWAGFKKRVIRLSTSLSLLVTADPRCYQALSA